MLDHTCAAGAKLPGSCVGRTPLFGFILQRVNQLYPKFIHRRLLTANHSGFEERWDDALLRTLRRDKVSSTALAERGSFQTREHTALSSRTDPSGLSGVRGVCMDLMQAET